MSLGACNGKVARGHLRRWAPKRGGVWSASPTCHDLAEHVLVLCRQEAPTRLTSTSYEDHAYVKAIRHAIDDGCCHGLEKQHRLQAFDIRGMATRPLLLSFLY